LSQKKTFHSVRVSTTTSPSHWSIDDREADYAHRSVSGVRRAERSDARAISRLLSRAFYDDPVATFLFPDRTTRTDLLNRFFDLQLGRNYLRRGVVSTTAVGDGAALWMPPGAPPPTLIERLVHTGFGFRLGERRAAAHRLTSLLERRHPKESHWYLGALGVEPDHQGQGIGTSLLQEMLVVCDAKRQGAYLEASRPESARLYGRLGFDLVELLDPTMVGIDGPELYLMYRKGRAAQS
jgi:GNAT superfamily N-acetyltransferase